MSKRLLDYDEARGLRIDYEALEGGGFALHYSQDVAPVIEMNKAKQLCGRDYYASDKDVWKVASIPVTVQYEWMRRYGVDPLKAEHSDLLERLLNDPEWRYLKTAEIII